MKCISFKIGKRKTISMLTISTTVFHSAGSLESSYWESREKKRNNRCKDQKERDKDSFFCGRYNRLGRKHNKLLEITS